MSDGSCIVLPDDDDSDEEFVQVSERYKGTKSSRCRSSLSYPHSKYAPPPVTAQALANYIICDVSLVENKADRKGTQAVMFGHFAVGGGYSYDGSTVAQNIQLLIAGKQGTLGATDFATAVDPALSNKFDDSTFAKSMEWCHGKAACLGGDTSYDNLYAASYDCNTFSASLEDWLRLKGRRMKARFKIVLYYEGRVTQNRTSTRRAPLYVKYMIAVKTRNDDFHRPVSFYIDCRVIGFSKTDYEGVHRKLSEHFSKYLG